MTAKVLEELRSQLLSQRDKFLLSDKDELPQTVVKQKSVDSKGLVASKRFLDEEFDESPMKKPSDSSINALSVLTGMTEKRALAIK